MAFHHLSYEQARVECVANGHGIRHGGMPAGAFVMMRGQTSAPPAGYSQTPWTPTQQDQQRNDWEVT